MRIKVGPIAADFHGTAEIDRDPCDAFGHDPGQRARPAQQLGDARRDPLSAAAAGRGATKVELNVGYRLTGPLAQFSRSDLVQDIASRMIAAFAQNVEARLSGDEQCRAGGGTQCRQPVLLRARRPD